jgi:hypothetical protein
MGVTTMCKDCWSCEHLFYDSTTDYAECKRIEYLTEAQVIKHFENGQPNCPLYTEHKEYVAGIYE